LFTPHSVTGKYETRSSPAIVPEFYMVEIDGCLRILPPHDSQALESLLGYALGAFPQKGIQGNVEGYFWRQYPSG